MYKGKFDQKNKQGTSNVQDLLEQRSRAASQTPPAGRPAPGSASDARQQPPRETPARPAPRANASQAPSRAPAREVPPQSSRPANAPARAQVPQQRPAPSPVPAKKQKRGPRLGGVIFYTLYFMFILAFFLATFVGLLWLRSWLVDFEASQPTVKAQQVFDSLFTDPQWGDLYDASGAQDTSFEGKEQFVAYMEERIGNDKLTYLETSAGLASDARKYVVRHGDENVASFTLVDKNHVGDTTLQNLDKIRKWDLGAVEVFFERTGSYRIEMMSGHTAYVNNKPLDDSHIIQIATTKAEDYLPKGTPGVEVCTQEITELFAKPTVTIFDEKGNQMDVAYNEETRTFVERTSGNTITDEQTTAVRMAVETNCLWMLAEITDRGKVAKYFDPTGDAYSFTSIPRSELWVQSNKGHEFTNFEISNFTMYSDDLFSVRASVDVNVTRKDDTVRTFDYAKSMFFKKNSKGSWLCTIATNVDIYEPRGKVRLTFMQDTNQIDSSLFATDAREIITPILTVPEGKVFGGWVIKSTDENGKPVMKLIFQPDETGRVSIPEGTTLEPMTLYAWFDNASAPAEGG